MNAPETALPLRVYWRQGCSSCVKVKEYLSGLGLEYESIDVGLRPQAMEELRALGVRSVPVVARGGDYVFAQALEDVSRFVGAEFHAERLRPELLMKKWLHVLAAAQRHVLQVPHARLGERATPGRDACGRHDRSHRGHRGDLALARACRRHAARARAGGQRSTLPR